MGIDARMAVRIGGRPPGEASEHQIKLWAWDLAAAIGAEKFWQSPLEVMDATERRFASARETLSGGEVKPSEVPGEAEGLPRIVAESLTEDIRRSIEQLGGAEEARGPSGGGHPWKDWRP